MRNRTTALILIFSLLEFASIGQTTPVNPNSTKATRDVLTYLWNLSYGTTPGVIVGQNCNHGNEITQYGYQQYVQNLADNTGKYVGMIGVDYEFMKVYSLSELKEANTKLIEYWNAGGLITINYSPLNILDFNSGAMSRGGGGTAYRILPGGDLRKAWLARLDVIADALLNLQNNGVPVLWRPMQEENGPLFWYATARFVPGGLSKSDFIALYRDMFNYFTDVKGLNNLLWVFAPTGSSSWSAYPYPGDDYVDIVSGTTYNNQLNVNQNDYNVYKKPIGVSEYGWDSSNTIARDNLIYQKKTSENPQISYWVSWHDWSNIKMSIIANDNASALMNHADILTRDELPNFKMIDSLAPTAPTGLKAEKITNLKFTLTWTPATDNFGVDGYDVYKDGTYAGSTATNSINITALTPATSYVMTVQAKDAQGQKSPLSDTLRVITEALPDATPPTAPSGLSATAITLSYFTLNWEASTDNIEVTTYQVYRNGVLVGSTASTAFKISGLKPGTTHKMHVYAKDAMGNKSESSAVLDVTMAVISDLNISYKKTVTVSSTTGNATASKAVDADPATRWESAWTNNEWIYVDLGQFYHVSRVILTWGNAFASGYKIQISDDAVVWEDMYSTATGNGETDNIEVQSTGRYVRVLLTKRATEYGYSLWELEVNGTLQTVGLLPATPDKLEDPVKIYPNPITQGMVHLVMAPFTTGHVQILDLRGKVVYHSNLNSQPADGLPITVDVKNCSKGFYLIKISTDQFVSTQKISIL
jgi:mannan endo-1,4-beta-mannosidase